MQRLEGTVAVITGGANGIGRATAVRFAEEGAAGIVVADLLEEAGRAVGAEVEAVGSKAVFHPLDASNPDHNVAVVRAAVDTLRAARHPRDRRRHQPRAVPIGRPQRRRRANGSRH